MELGVLDRLSLLQILPKEGDLTTIRLVRELREDLSFTEEEHEEFQFQYDGDNVAWKNGKDKEIEIGEKKTEIIKKALKDLNKSKKVTEQFLNLYDKFQIKE